jgi:hypothetical protein
MATSAPSNPATCVDSLIPRCRWSCRSLLVCLRHTRGAPSRPQAAPREHPGLAWHTTNNNNYTATTTTPCPLHGSLAHRAARPESKGTALGQRALAKEFAVTRKACHP